MNSFIEALNGYGARFLDFAWPVLWQSSLLIIVIAALDFVLRRKLRAAVRYALWLVVLLKLLLPPSLALPTGVAWWLSSGKVTEPKTKAQFIVTYDQTAIDAAPKPVQFLAPPARARLSAPAWGILGACLVSISLLFFLLFRWRQMLGRIRQATCASESHRKLLFEMRRVVGVRRAIGLRITNEAISPAVCGLFRPVVLLPELLAEHLSPGQIRAVLLHELIHLRRGDVWMNCLQTLLQIVYWWHPLLWLANARIRRLREEAVDDAVMLALNKDAEVYAPTLIEVAKLAFRRPMATLGFVGILESRTALRRRVERLVNFTAPGRAGLSLVSILAVSTFAALAVPMGQAPSTSETGSNTAGLSPAKEQTSASAHTDLILERQEILKKLEHLRLASVSYQNLPLSNVVRQLNWEVRRGDPDEKGIPFLFHGNDVAAVRINLESALTNVLLGDALEAIVRVADKPIRYSIEQSAIVFSKKREKGEPLFRRRFRIDSKALYADLQGTGLLTSDQSDTGGFTNINKGGTPTIAPLDPAATKTVQEAVVKFLDLVGIDMSQPGYSLFFNDREGTLLVRATFGDLGKVEKLLASLDLFAQVNSADDARLIQDARHLYELGKLDASEAKLEEVLVTEPTNPQAVYYENLIKESRASGQNSLGATPQFPGHPKQEMRPVLVSQPDPGNTARRSMNAGGRQPQIEIHSRFVEMNESAAMKVWQHLPVSTNQLSRTAVVAEGNRLPPNVGTSSNTFDVAWSVLTPTQTARLLTELKSETGVNLLNGPKVTTTSGRQAQIQIADIKNVVTGYNATNGYVTTRIPLGPTLDVVPYLTKDADSIQLDLVPSVVEFLGYDDPGPFTMEKPGTPNESFSERVLPLPHFRVGQTSGNVRLHDGQTVLMGPITTTNRVQVRDKVPVLGDLPGMGKLFRSTSEQHEKTSLYIFVSAKLIKAAGNRVRSENGESVNRAGDATQPK